MDVLNAREWAVTAWLSIGIVLSMLSHGIRRALSNVIKTALQGKVVTLFLVCWTYIAACVALLSWAGLWDEGQIKTTILWALFTTPPLVFRVASETPAPQLVRGWMSDTIAVTVLMELIAFTYVFAFWQEMIIVPAAFFVSGLMAVAGRKKEFRPILQLLQIVVAISAVYLLARGAWMIVTNWNSFATLATVRDTYIVPLLSFMVIPLLYGVFLYAAYDSAFSGTRVAIPDPKLRDYAQTVAGIAFHVNVDQLRRWVREIHLERPLTRDQIKSSIKAVRSAAARADTPALVPEAEGWCPVSARQFLAKQGYATGNYQESSGDWFASSLPNEVGSGIWPHNIAFHVEGEERSAQRLALKLNINQPEERPEAIALFLELAGSLVARALHQQNTTEVRSILAKGEPFEMIVATTEVRLLRDEFTNKTLKGYSLCLEFMRPGPAASSKAKPDTQRA